MSALCIVVGFDFSEGAELALEQAVQLGVNRPGAVLRVLAVGARVGDAVRLEHHGHIATVSDAAAAAALDLHIARSLDTMVAGGTQRPDITCHVAAGSAAAEIVRFAAEYDADVIVVGTHGRHGLGRLLLGSVAEKVVRDAGCAVLVARRKKHDVSP
jgi:nucleotide-binding universal stress UspA family protein